jgi:hypothetical protein
MARIERLHHAGGKNVGIVFLLRKEDSQEGGTRDLMNLQAMYEMSIPGLLETLNKTRSLLSSGIEMHIIPLCSISSLSQTLSTFHQQLFRSHHPTPTANSVNALLPYCSNTPPISEHARNVLSDICSSVPELAQASTTLDGQKWLKSWLTEQSSVTADDVIGFWEQEYIAE